MEFLFLQGNFRILWGVHFTWMRVSGRAIDLSGLETKRTKGSRNLGESRAVNFFEQLDNSGVWHGTTATLKKAF
jgi:hypothetical protein